MWKTVENFVPSMVDETIYFDGNDVVINGQLDHV